MDDEEEKGYLTFNTDWIAKNYQEVQIAPRGHIEGTFIQQTKELKTQYNYETGGDSRRIPDGCASNRIQHTIYAKESR